MGKIVKSAKVADSRYYVDIPVAAAEAAPEPASIEHDDRFVTSYDDPFTRELRESGYAAAPPPAPAVEARASVDWETLRAEAEAIVDQAANDAERLLKQAETISLDLVAKARAKVAEIEEAARAAGDERGYAEGKQKGETELDPVIATFREVAQSIREQRRALLEASEPEIVRLAMAIAERIVHTEIATNPSVVLGNVRSALTRITSREVVTLRVNPADHDIIRAHRDAIHAASDVEHLRIVEDQRVDRGGVMVETEAGTIDAKVATQLMEARRAILSEDSIALGPSLDDQEMLEPSPAAS